MKGGFLCFGLLITNYLCPRLRSCHRTHNKPHITNTLLAVNMYSNFEMQYGLDDEYDFGRYD